MALACQCRGDLALRHRECAIKWAQVKGSNVCELCKAPVTNLPALPPRPPAAQDLEDQYMSGTRADDWCKGQQGFQGGGVGWFEGQPPLAPAG